MQANSFLQTAVIGDDRAVVFGKTAADASDGAAAQTLAADAGSVADSSRGVTRDERKNTTAHIDWFACTFQPNSVFKEVIDSVFTLPQVLWKRRRGGWQGYDVCIDLGPFGLLAYGGEHQRGTAHLSLNAHGCAGVQDWNAVRDWCESCGARIARIDLAHDDFSGENISVEKALAWFKEGRFTTGGRAPCAKLYDDLDSNEGKTLYVGKRQNGKLCRVYEKGKQLGDPRSRWCRVEVELRGKGRLIPYDILIRPGEYLAGTYPCLAPLSKQQDKVRTLSKSAEIAYERMVDCLRTQYGPTVHVMMQVERGDIFEVFKQIERPGTPKRLEHLPLPRGESRKGNES